MQTAPGSRAKKQAAFLAALSEGHTVTEAAKAAGVDARTPYRWRDGNAAFAAKWAAAVAAGTDTIEQEAFRRAVVGIEKPIYRGGEVVGHVTEFSDSMLAMLLKARRPELYGAKPGGPNAMPDLEGARDALLRKFAEATDGGDTD